MFKEKDSLKKLIMLGLLFIIALLSFFFISDFLSSPNLYTDIIQVLDDKKMTAMELTTAVTVTSTALSAAPGDIATPIANQISGLAPYLFIVVCAIYFEKFLLTISGYIAFRYLIPLACVLLGIYILNHSAALKAIAAKLALFALVITMIIPFSVKITNLLEASFQESINQTFSSVEEITEEAEKNDSNAFLDFLNSIGNGIANVGENIKNSISVFIDAVAVLIITTCVIPIAVFLFLFWITKLILGLNIDSAKIKKLIPSKQIKE